MLKAGTVVDAALIAAPRSTKNKDGEFDPAWPLIDTLPTHSELGPTPTPTCLPGQGGQPKGNVTENGKQAGRVGPPLNRRVFSCLIPSCRKA